MTEGVKGGAVNRPASAQEIAKLPRSRCGRCGFEGVKPMVVDGACTNVQACRIRVARRDRERKEAKR